MLYLRNIYIYEDVLQIIFYFYISIKDDSYLFIETDFNH